MVVLKVSWCCIDLREESREAVRGGLPSLRQPWAAKAIFLQAALFR
jgi:hypothetical protein